jgi:hypothetical protein
LFSHLVHVAVVLGAGNFSALPSISSMSLAAAYMDGEGEIAAAESGGPRSPLLFSDSTDSEQSSLVDSEVGSPFDVLQRAVLQIPCRDTQISLGHVAQMMHGMEANLLKLMQHLGVTPVIQSRLHLVSLRSNSASPQALSPSLKPQCPLCRSSNFKSEKHFVQHLGAAITALDHQIHGIVRPISQRPSACFFSPSRHSAMVGLSPGKATSADVKSFITVYKSCFSASECSGFDVVRCQNAAEFLATSEGLGAGLAPDAD